MTHKTSTGNGSTGHYSTGNYSTGNWSTGSYSVGTLSTDDYAPYGLFNVAMPPGSLKEVVFPDYFYFNTTEWVKADDMTDAEKLEHPSHVTTGGYLRVYGYREAWRRAWDSAAHEDRLATTKLPHWNNEVFREISGIDVEAELQKKRVTIELTEDQLRQVHHILRG